MSPSGENTQDFGLSTAWDKHPFKTRTSSAERLTVAGTGAGESAALGWVLEPAGRMGRRDVAWAAWRRSSHNVLLSGALKMLLET